MKKLKIIQLFTRLKLFRYLCFAFCLFGFVGFGFCELYSSNLIRTNFTIANNNKLVSEIFDFVSGNYNCFVPRYTSSSFKIEFYDSSNNLVFDTTSGIGLYCPSVGDYFVSSSSSQVQVYAYSIPIGGSSTCEDKSITVYYNSGNTESILCDGTQAIEIKGLSSLTSTNTFTPYYNILYTDEDNQKLTESYSKDILYLENGQFKKTYTGNNERILTVQGNDSENIFTGYLPTFDVTGSIDKNNEFTGNVFNNFADNSLKVLLSNIPSYIQYVIMIILLFFILGFIRKFKRR